MKTIEYKLTENNCHIVNSFLIKDKIEMKWFLEETLPEHFYKTRSLKSYIREWRAHNLLYKWHYQVKRTKDCDLNINETWYRRLGYFILSLLYI